MKDNADILIGAMKRLQSELNYYHKELNKINNKLSDCQDEFEERKLKELMDETLAAMCVTREKMRECAKELTEMGLEPDVELSHASMAT